MKKLAQIIFIVLVPQILIALLIYNYQNIKNEGNLAALKKQYKEKPKQVVAHGAFEELNKNFDNVHEVTAACLSCHNKRGEELLHSPHYRWERETFIPGRGVVYIGKKNLINNLCTGIAGSEQACTRCHTGYGWDDKNYDFSDEKNIDCLVCHDNSGPYAKGSGMAGYPATGENAPDYQLIAAHIGKPGKQNCGTCHFFSSGGNNVKHGELEKALLDCTREVDVHMAANGLDMKCVDCHTAENHEIKGRYYGVSSRDYNRATCEQCHEENPHKDELINEHTIKVACQTCHIPVYAKVNPTKMHWDWSTVGKLKDGKPYAEKDEDGNVTYLSIKGTFKWEKNVKPEYKWFNGKANHYLFTDEIDTVPVQINTLFGSYSDEKAKIWPVKIHRSNQAYDKEYNRLVQPKLWDAEKGNNALWLDLEWQPAIKAGMEEMELPYSGNYGFVKTEMYLPLNHMVSPAENTLSCKDCHDRQNSRLKNLDDFYMPGRDRNKTIDMIGLIVIFGSLGGVSLHAITRYYFYRKRKQKQN